MEISNKVVILGAGESGVGAAILAKKQGFEVFVSDSGSIKPNHRQTLSQWHILFEEGQNSSLCTEASMVIKSPGIPETAPIIQALRAKNIPTYNFILR